MIRYTPSQFCRAVMQTVKTWYKYHAKNGPAHKFILADGSEDLLFQARAILGKYQRAEGNEERWLAIQGAMSMGHCGDYGSLLEVWGRGEFADIVDLIRKQGALAYFDETEFRRWIDR